LFSHPSWVTTYTGPAPQEILDPVSLIRGEMYPPAESYMTMMAPEETLCPPFLVCNARLIEPIIVLTPELGDDFGTSGVPDTGPAPQEILDPVSLIRGEMYPPAESYMTMMALPLLLWLWLWYGCRETMGDTGDLGGS
jgi:hypothetical protein